MFVEKLGFWQSGVVSEDSRLAPLSGSMTKWDYMVVVWDPSYSSPPARTTSGKDLDGAKWHPKSRHIGLKELGEKGWELIKIRGTETEFLYFKRPL
tara:strand:+ start:1638 stop:1925 length:288 start_codon:yes stop_codon:yes gene_type:complete